MADPISPRCPATKTRFPLMSKRSLGAIQLQIPNGDSDNSCDVNIVPIPASQAPAVVTLDGVVFQFFYRGNPCWSRGRPNRSGAFESESMRVFVAKGNGGGPGVRLRKCQRAKKAKIGWSAECNPHCQGRVCVEGVQRRRG